jgi:DNA-binding IclR family transcriptional regulator
MEPVERAFFVVEKTHEVGRMSGAILARIPGWDKVKAHRYLTQLARLGWLEKLNTEKGRPVYVLGRKLLGMAPDLRI